MSKNVTLLYVDDEPINLMLFETCFKDKYTVLTSLSGSEGLKILEHNSNISAIVSDMKMPGMNGIDFIRQAKAVYPKIACYILTGFNLSEEIAKALDEGLILNCFFKPLNIEEIENAINNAGHLI
jgi:response regulator RpfG family c-di-GMP phosphodiesterase